MFIAVEGRNYWDAEEKFVGALKEEVKGAHKTSTTLVGSQAFLAYMRSKSTLVDFLFVEDILSLIDSRSSMGKENRETSLWFGEHRKVGAEHIVLSDLFELDYVDLRIRRLVTHRIYVAEDVDDVRYRVVSLNVGRAVRGKLSEETILGTIEESNRPLTPEELEQREKELELGLE